MDITATLVGQIMKLDPADPQWSGRDRFILSKGHGVLGYYTALAEVGYLSRDDLMTFEQPGTELCGHPVMNRAKGIEFSNGSLGMGLALGIGVALAARKRNQDNRVFVLMGDGECNEGSVWEAAMAAPQYRLDNLVAIIDRNNWQQTGDGKTIMDLGDLAEKWRSFGWQVAEIDGHDPQALYRCFSQTNDSGKPLAVVAHTVKGKASSSLKTTTPGITPYSPRPTTRRPCKAWRRNSSMPDIAIAKAKTNLWSKIGSRATYGMTVLELAKHMMI